LFQHVTECNQNKATECEKCFFVNPAGFCELEAGCVYDANTGVRKASRTPNTDLDLYDALARYLWTYNPVKSNDFLLRERKNYVWSTSNGIYPGERIWGNTKYRFTNGESVTLSGVSIAWIIETIYGTRKQEGIFVIMDWSYNVLYEYNFYNSNNIAWSTQTPSVKHVCDFGKDVNVRGLRMFIRDLKPWESTANNRHQWSFWKGHVEFHPPRRNLVNRWSEVNVLQYVEYAFSITVNDNFPGKTGPDFAHHHLARLFDLQFGQYHQDREARGVFSRRHVVGKSVDLEIKFFNPIQPVGIRISPPIPEASFDMSRETPSKIVVQMTLADYTVITVEDVPGAAFGSYTPLTMALPDSFVEANHQVLKIVFEIYWPLTGHTWTDGVTTSWVTIGEIEIFEAAGTRQMLPGLP